jgi:cystathionine gamma-lyase
MGFATDCIHAGQHPDPTTGAVITPLYLTSTYVQEGIDKHKGFEYGRTQNRDALRARSEPGGTRRWRAGGICFASGLAASNAVLSFVKPGQRVVVSDNVYGGTHRLFTKLIAPYGVTFDFVDL